MGESRAPETLGVVFVSSDANEEAALAHFQKMGSEFSRQGEWCMVDYNSGMRQELKRLYGAETRADS
ncbi:hypothetical protein T484DRAFT_1788723 [Baffinella frigidus]|nr:hypothetical protein T484DRAFT_1788723 [Cryptophyta sp. CCMP2293]